MKPSESFQLSPAQSALSKNQPIIKNNPSKISSEGSQASLSKVQSS